MTGLLAPPCLALVRRISACSARMCQCAPRPLVSWRANKAECMLCQGLLLQFSWAGLEERPLHQLCSHKCCASTRHNRHSSEADGVERCWITPGLASKSWSLSVQMGHTVSGLSQKEDERLDCRAEAREHRTQGKQSKHAQTPALHQGLRLCARASVDLRATRPKTFHSSC